MEPAGRARGGPGGPGSWRSRRSGPPGGWRLRVKVLIAVQLLVPAILLGVRWADPSAGQQPFGWQMHTSCWGSEEPCR